MYNGSRFYLTFKHHESDREFVWQSKNTDSYHLTENALSMEISHNDKIYLIQKCLWLVSSLKKKWPIKNYERIAYVHYKINTAAKWTKQMCNLYAMIPLQKCSALISDVKIVCAYFILCENFQNIINGALIHLTLVHRKKKSH